MQTQSFLLKEPTTDDLPSADELTDEVKQRQALLGELRFHTVQHWETAGADKLFRAQMFYPELSGKTYKLWRQFLPTTVQEREFRDYRFDAPPTEALEAIKTAKELQCFARIEIWTPEGNSFMGYAARKLKASEEKIRKFGDRIDPMAVGVAVDQNGVEYYHQIVRWGESLQEVKKIKAHVAKVNWQARLLFWVLPVLVATFGVAAYVVGIQNFGFATMILYTLLGILFTAFLVVLTAVVRDLLG